MKEHRIKISSNGIVTTVPSICVADRSVIIKGKLIKVASIHDEPFLDGELVEDPRTFVTALQRWSKRPDIFEFPENLMQPEPRFTFRTELDNVAAAPTHSFTYWWNKLPQETRKNVRRSAKRGIVVRVVTFGDELVRGIKAIYDESRFRQGRRFWHFGKPFEAVKAENGTYLDRSEFIGAYHNDQLIGFIKVVYANGVARIMQILAKDAHQDKRPMNALIAKAVEVCEQKGASYLIYSRFHFGRNKVSALTEFKRRNGFEKMIFPRYYVPLTLKGRIAMQLNLHRDTLAMLPPQFITAFLWFRSACTKAKARCIPAYRNEQPFAKDKSFRFHLPV